MEMLKSKYMDSKEKVRGSKPKSGGVRGFCKNKIIA